MGVNKRKLVLSHKGVKIYHSWKGARSQSYWYALTPKHDAEGESRDFDIRNLPEAYREGLQIELILRFDLPDEEARLSHTQAFDDMMAAHQEVLRRAIDDGHDFQRSIKKDHRREETWFTRLVDWLADQQLKRRKARAAGGR